jgi:hypothetical protein
MPSRQGRRGGSAVVLVLGGLVLLGCLGASPTAALAVQAAPDLRPAAPTPHPAHPYEGVIVEVSVVIVNQGDATATAASIDLVDARPGGGAPVPIGGSVTLTAPLGAGASVMLSMPPFIAAGVGMHTLTIRVGNVTPAEVQPGGGAISIPLEVLPANTSSSPPPPSDGIHIEGLESLGLGVLLGLLVVVLGIGVAVAAVGRRRSQELEPPPPEPPDRSPPPLWPP